MKKAELHSFCFKMSLNHLDGDTESNFDEKDKETEQNTKDNEGNGDSDLEDTTKELSTSSTLASLEFSEASLIDDYNLNSSGDEEDEETRQNQSTKADQVADQIIKVFIVKRKQRLIDQDDQNYNISYEESEKRLILIGLGTATLFSLSSLICIILIFQAFEVQDQKIFSGVPIIEDEDSNFPIPHVAFMNRRHDGSMLVFKLINQSNFDYAWKFKVPDQGGGESQTYFMFEDLSNIHVAFSNEKLKMTVIQSPSKHFTVPKSELRQEFLGGHSFRWGNFVMFFGGVNKDMPILHCSSVNDHTNKVKTQIWSIKRKVWINGPYLPKNPELAGCVNFASGVSINRTHGILFHAYRRNMSESDCIDVFVFSAETFDWVVIKKCVLLLGNDLIAKKLHLYKFICSAYLNKSGKMQVLMLLQHVYRSKISETKIYKVDYPGLNYEFILIHNDDLKAKEWSLFNLRSTAYLANFYQNTATFYHLDMKLNMSLISLQELNHPNISDIFACDPYFEEALPFYP